MFCGCPATFGGGAEHPGLPDLPRPPRRDAGGQRQGRGVGDPDRAGAELRDRRVVPVRAEELLLPGHAEELPDLAVRRADRVRRLDRGRVSTARPSGSRSSARTWRRTPASRCTWAGHRADPRRRLLAGRLQPRRHPADRDRHQADRGRPGEGAARGAGVRRRSCATCCSALGVSDVRMEQGSLRCDVNLSLRRSGSDELGTRTETKNVNSLRSVERAVRYEIARQAGDPRRRAARSSRRPGTGTRTPASRPRAGRSPTPRTTATSPSPTSCRSRRTGSGSSSCGPTCPSRRASAAARLQAEWGFSDLEMRDTVGAGALDLVEETIAAGAAPQAARKWWLSELARRANEQGVELAELPVTPADVARDPGARRRGRDQRQAGPAGLRRRAGR